MLNGGGFLRALMRGTFRRGIFLLVVGSLTFLGAGLLIGVADDRQERLQADGTAIEGTVIEADNPLRGPNSVLVRYRVSGRAYEERILGSNSYTVGAAVTVYVDPSDPASATLGGEQPQSTPTYYLTLVLVVLSLLLLGAGIANLWRAWREH